MMCELKLICVGFNVFEVNDSDIKCVLFFDKLPKGIPLSELIFAIQRMAKSADAILVNTGMKKDELSVEEALFLQLAYTIYTPIFGIGGVDGGEFLSAIALNRFETFDDAVDHIKTNYSGGY